MSFYPEPGKKDRFSALQKAVGLKDKMGLFNSNKKKLAEALEAQQRLEDEIVTRKRKEVAEKERMEALHKQQMEQTRLQLEQTRLAREKLERDENTRRAQEYERQRIEKERLEREARARRDAQRKIKEASPETLRNLRELIRNKYQLDVEIWRLRGARKPDRWIVESKMEKADAVMSEIRAMVGVWTDNSDRRWDPEEWEKVQDIRRRLDSSGIRNWAEEPLWNDGQGTSNTSSPRSGGSVYRRETGAYRRQTVAQRRESLSNRFEAPDRRYA
jgi:hypothetical protein